MTDVSVCEAARAVMDDYTNGAAHLFLADSYNELRDPPRFNLRYENIWFNELLLADVLSRVGGGHLSQQVSQQEYSKLFQADSLGLANSTYYRSDNNSITEQVSQYGTIGWTSYSLDLNYQHNDGTRPNNELDNIEWYSTVKQQITPQDTALILVKYVDYHSGDNFQYYNPNRARRYYHFDENQEPIIIGAWHHEWSPGVHTLLMGGRIPTEQTVSDRGAFYASDSEPFDVRYHNKFDIYLAELN